MYLEQRCNPIPLEQNTEPLSVVKGKARSHAPVQRFMLLGRGFSWLVRGLGLLQVQADLRLVL
jgi:hypothetical protein